MMKYIRTENGIYEVVGFDDECIIPSPIIKMNGKLTHCSDYKNCKQSDTIEELCDEFVVIEETQNYVMEICSYKGLKDNGWIGSNFTIYGAIWTSKGLIYVAIMNDKGGFELIWKRKSASYQKKKELKYA